MVQSIPGELSLQETPVLTATSNEGHRCVTVSLLINELKWTEFRANQAIESILGDGLAWVDCQTNEKSYCFPSLFPGRQLTAS